MMAAPGIGGTPSSTRTGVVPGRIKHQELFAPFPSPLLDQARRRTKFLEDQPDETRMRTGEMMEQGQHAIGCEQ